MIKHYRHKGLEALAEKANARGIDPSLAKRLTIRLRMLEDSIEPSDMDVPGWNLHELKGERTGTWSVKVSGNWRLTFKFEDGNAVDVDLEDYH
jgi:proteic killer suppression protein